MNWKKAAITGALAIQLLCPLLDPDGIVRHVRADQSGTWVVVHVYDDKDGNGTINSGENGIPGVQVCFSYEYACDTTDANGNAQMNMVTPQDFRFWIEPAPAHCTNAEPNAYPYGGSCGRNLSVTPSQDIVTIFFGVQTPLYQQYLPIIGR